MQKSTATASVNGSNEAGDFECNNFFELAQDPIVTLCHHLYCWPCLYRWLRLHSQSHECPVCKALIQEEKLPVPGVEIHKRPRGQRPETAPPPESSTFPNPRFGLMEGFFPGATASFGNFTLSAGFGGLFPSLLSFQFHGFPGSSSFCSTPNYQFGYPPSYHGANVHKHPKDRDNNLQFMFLVCWISCSPIFVWLLNERSCSSQAAIV
ncbi:unnamed protein product [Withania somnifera]